MSQIQRFTVSCCKAGCLAVFALLVSTFPLRAQDVANATTTADIYVSPRGNDAWAGTYSAPFATLDRARAAVRAAKSTIANRPITVLLRGGPFYLPSTWTFTSADSGTAATPIVYANYPGEVPIISGGRLLSGWVQNSDGSWTTTVNPKTYFTQLWRNGARLPRPRTTPSSYLFILNPHTSVQNPPAADGFYYHNPPAGGVPASMANLSDVELVNFEYWDVPRLKIASIDTTAQLITTTQSLAQDPHHGFLVGHRFLLENVKEALKLPGQWYLDRSTWTLTYLPKSGELLSQQSFVAPRLQKIMSATSLSYVTFRGLTFAHNDFQNPSTGYLSGQAANSTSAAITLKNSNNVVFQGCTVQHTGGYGIEFIGASSGVAFRDGSITDTGAGGIRIGTLANCSDTDASIPHNSSITNNLVTDTGRVFPEAFNVLVGNAHHMLVQNNEVADGYASGIGVGFNWNYGCNLAHDNLVQYNHIHDMGQGVTSDIGGVYFLTGVTTGNRILNNKVHDVVNDPGGYGGWGLYLDNGSLQVLVQNNLVYRTTAASFHLNISGQPAPRPTPSPNLFLNNIIVLGGEGVLDRHNDSGDMTLAVRNNIIYYDKPPLQFGYWNCRSMKSCTSFFQFDNNLYFDTNVAGGQPGTPFISTPVTPPDSGRQPPITFLSMTQWKALGEDTHSFFADPLFTNPTRGIDDYSLQANSPAFGLGFKSFDATKADRLPGFRGTFRLAPAAFPVQIKSATY